MHFLTTSKNARLRPKKGKKLPKVFFKAFLPYPSLGEKKSLSHMKLKNKIRYLGEKNCIQPKQMSEQLAVEFDVKKSHTLAVHSSIHGEDPLFGLGLYVTLCM